MVYQKTIDIIEEIFKKDMYFIAEMSDTPVLECLTRDELGWAIGKAKRTAVVVLDNSFANMINKNI